MTDSYLLYDGECPLCSRYVKMTRLRETLPGFKLVDARERPDLVAEHRKSGREINAGMILAVEGKFYHGADALNGIALLSTPSRWTNRFNAALFRSKKLSRIAYPCMVRGRNLLLRIMGLDLVD
jgi:predicted DCC family thiol-disulfide oxidoreductase YuxK